MTLFSLSRLFVTLLVISFLAETGVMFLLPVALPRASRTVEAFADAVLLTVIIAPVIGWLVIRPLQGAALREKAHAAAVIAHALDGILTLDQLGIVASCNPAAEAMFGYSSAELMGKSIESLVSRPGRDESSHQSLIEQLICNFHGQRAGLKFQGR